MLRFSIPMIPTTVLWIVTGFSDRLFVRYMDGFAVSADVGETAAGVYEASSKVPNLISMVSTIFFQAWNMSAITENNSKDRSNFYYRIFSAYQSLMFLAAAFMIALVKPLSAILIDYSVYPEYARAYQYTPVLIIAVLLMSFNQFLSSIYTATQKTTHSFWSSLAAAAANLVLNTILIYYFGVHGAVIATFASYFICYLIRIVDTRKLIPFKVHHMRFALNLVILFAMSFAAILEPSFIIPFQIVLLLFMCVFNFQAILQTVKKVRKQINPTLQIDGILLTMVDNRTNFGKEISVLLRETYGSSLNVFRTEIPHSVKAKESNAEGKSIYAYDDSCKVAEAYKNLVREVLYLEKQREKRDLDLGR
jgi:O-antigen/teichoic acid export membrane protein